MVQQPIEDRGLLTDNLPTSTLPADRVGGSSRKFRNEVESPRCYFLSRPGLPLQINSYTNPSQRYIGTDLKHWPKIPPPLGIKPAPE